MSGMSDEAEQALEAMRARGAIWLGRAALLDAAEPVPPAPRPSPRPPVEARPHQLSVTRITTLVRDPYAIYADKILGLRALRALYQSPDAPLRGTILHEVMERFVKETPEGESREQGHARLMDTAREVLEAEAPWPAARVLWLAKLGRVADAFLAGEEDRRSRASPAKLEAKGELSFDTLGFALTGTADRIDRDPDGALYIYDYKSGHIPTKAERDHIDKQLSLEAVMARAGAFEGIVAANVVELGYIGLGANPVFERISIGDAEIAETRDEFIALIGKYMHRAQGYTAKRLAETQRFSGDYDHLSRYGEWDLSSPAVPEDVGE
jgi:RecB family exonuclease